MPTSNRKSERYVASLEGKIHHDAVIENQRIWRTLFDLVDRQFDFVDVLMTRNTLFNPPTTIGKPLIGVLRQDTVGGWTITWGDKFKGTNTLTPLDTTLNTYTAAIFYPVSYSIVYLISGITGGTL